MVNNTILGVHGVDVDLEKNEIRVKGKIEVVKIHKEIEKWSKKKVELISPKPSEVKKTTTTTTTTTSVVEKKTTEVKKVSFFHNPILPYIYIYIFSINGFCESFLTIFHRMLFARQY